MGLWEGCALEQHQQPRVGAWRSGVGLNTRAPRVAAVIVPVVASHPTDTHPLNTSPVQGSVVVIRYEGPKGGPGMPEMLTPTSAIMGAGLGKECALITDGRFR